MSSSPTPDRVGIVVLAGGRSRRFGSDKLAAPVAGRPLLDTLLIGLPADADIVCVGPRRPTARPVRWVLEDPPLGGPLAGVAAGVGILATDVVVVLAGDMPWSGPAIGTLLTALRQAPRAAAALARDDDGQVNPLLGAYRREALAAYLPDPAHGLPARKLLGLPHVEVPITGRPGRDVDVPTDLPGAR